ncbi:MAG: hypothetical protein AAGC46_17485 [Solirubrobacteraceae bacterium]|nr:hypothetical protein [Patulibacter sp.]
MAGRGWAKSPPPEPTGGKARPRPSERAKGVQPTPAERPATKASASTQPTTAARRKKAPPSPEAMERARALLNPPKAPWHPLPLAEAAIVIGMVAMLVSVALKNAVGASAGFTLIILGTGEFSWREHRHGYRSHASILGGIIALIVGIVAWRLLGVTRSVCIGIAVVVFLMALGMLDRTYVPARQRGSAPDAEPPSGD